ncbi:MAG TPA: hypothetical protein VH369_05055 [Bryobacteraceae bacterium]
MGKKVRVGVIGPRRQVTAVLDAVSRSLAKGGSCGVRQFAEPEKN